MEKNVPDLSRTIIRRYEAYDAADHRHDERAGKRRFTSHDPAMSKINLDHMIAELLSEASRDAAAYLEHVNVEDGRLKATEDHYSQRLSETLYNQRNQTTAWLQHELNRIENKKGSSSSRHVEYSRRATETEEELSRVRARLEPPLRPLRRHVHPFIYLFLLVSFGLVEMPLNRLSFELFFEEAQWIAWIMALGAGTMLMGLAHFGGTGVRQFRSKGRSAASLLLGLLGLALIFLAAGVLLYVVAVLRQGYVDFALGNANADMTESILGNESLPDQVAGVILNTNLGGIGLQFLALNGVIFSVGVFLAFFRHDPDHDYEPAWKRDKAARARLSALNEEFARDRDRLQKSHGSTLVLLNREINETEDRLEAAKQSRQRLACQIEPDLLVISRGVIHRAQVQRTAYYDQAGQQRIVLPEYAIPTDAEVLRDLKNKADQGRLLNTHSPNASIVVEPNVRPNRFQAPLTNKDHAAPPPGSLQ